MEVKQIIEVIVKSFLYTLLILFVINLGVFMFRLGDILNSGVKIISIEFSNFQFMLNERPGHNQFSNDHLLTNIIVFLTVATFVSRNEYFLNRQALK